MLHGSRKFLQGEVRAEVKVGSLISLTLSSSREILVSETCCKASEPNEPYILYLQCNHQEKSLLALWEFCV